MHLKSEIQRYRNLASGPAPRPDLKWPWASEYRWLWSEPQCDRVPLSRQLLWVAPPKGVWTPPSDFPKTSTTSRVEWRVVMATHVLLLILGGLLAIVRRTRAALGAA